MKNIDFEEIARMSAARLREELSSEKKDSKRARDYSTILKEMMALQREHAAYEDQTMIVQFKNGAKEAAE